MLTLNRELKQLLYLCWNRYDNRNDSTEKGTFHLKTLTLFLGKTPQEFPVSEHQIHFTEEEDGTQSQKSQGGSEAESYCGVEHSVVGWRETIKYPHPR